MRSAAVTGAARGLGAAIAERLCLEGYALHLVDRDPDVHATAKRLTELGHGRADAHVTDLGQESEILALATALGPIDILVNNAGIHPKENGAAIPIDRMSVAAWNEMIAINLTAPFVLCREVLPQMRSRKWGRIINISSRAGRTLSPLASVAYAATKAGLLGFSRTLAAEVASDGITVNRVAPGPVVTPWTEASSKQVQRQLVDSIPLGRYANVEEIAAAACFLASDDASYMTGSVLDVNGGSFMA